MYNHLGVAQIVVHATHPGRVKWREIPDLGSVDAGLALVQHKLWVTSLDVVVSGDLSTISQEAHLFLVLSREGQALPEFRTRVGPMLIPNSRVDDGTSVDYAVCSLGRQLPTPESC